MSLLRHFRYFAVELSVITFCVGLIIFLVFGPTE